MPRVNVFLKWCAALAVFTTCSVHGFDLSLESGGVRGAFSNPFNRARFYHTEAFLNWDTPWRWQPAADWTFATRLELTGGRMFGRGDDAAFVTVGPGFVVSRAPWPVALELGVSPTVLGRERFGKTDYGSYFQFTSHAGLAWHVTERCAVGARFLHISNADIGPSNPGLNLYSLGVGWQF